MRAEAKSKYMAEIHNAIVAKRTRRARDLIITNQPFSYSEKQQISKMLIKISKMLVNILNILFKMSRIWSKCRKFG